MSVSLIWSPDFDAYHFCNFYTTGQKAIVPSLDSNQLAVGPPQPIVSVACEPTPGGNNTCLPVYGMLLFSIMTNRQLIVNANSEL
jgi:hypothetical protein